MDFLLLLQDTIDSEKAKWKETFGFHFYMVPLELFDNWKIDLQHTASPDAFCSGMCLGLPSFVPVLSVRIPLEKECVVVPYLVLLRRSVGLSGISVPMVRLCIRSRGIFSGRRLVVPFLLCLLVRSVLLAR